MFEVWQELSRFMNFIEELRYLDYSFATARKCMVQEAFKWIKPFVHLVMIYSAKISIKEVKQDDTQVLEHDHSKCESIAQGLIETDHDVIKEQFNEAKPLDNINFDDLVNCPELSLIDDTTQIYESHEVIMPGFVYEWFKLPDFPLNNGPTNNIYRCFSSIEEIDIHSNFFDDLTNNWFEFIAPKQFYDVINSIKKQSVNEEDELSQYLLEDEATRIATNDKDIDQFDKVTRFSLFRNNFINGGEDKYHILNFLMNMTDHYEAFN